jgi:hypothetical protein
MDITYVDNRSPPHASASSLPPDNLWSWHGVHERVKRSWQCNMGREADVGAPSSLPCPTGQIARGRRGYLLDNRGGYLLETTTAACWRSKQSTQTSAQYRLYGSSGAFFALFVLLHR